MVKILRVSANRAIEETNTVSYVPLRFQQKKEEEEEEDVNGVYLQRRYEVVTAGRRMAEVEKLTGGKSGGDWRAWTTATHGEG
ncbi:hypothetical protein QJS10_CPB14g01382 [Acorus calamus]|uniref:Uncharacterized protein n=1 Tax=Acorus calamus TaxID=4465 RepID=A0AAV9DA14_ACOCL|nr:hypothetical protein QJS10_CPB14g01382 [Acorus calamus]